MKKTLLLVLLGTSVLMSSCSSPRLTVVIAPDYEAYLKGENVLSSLDKTLAFGRGRFMDKRKDPSYVGFFSGVGNATLVYTDQTADDILFEGLKNIFTRSGHRWADPPDTDVLIDIILQEMVATEGMLPATRTQTAKARLDVQLSFVNSATDRVFYTSSYSGSSTRPYDVKERVQMAIISCMDNVGNDLKLARAIIAHFKSASEPN